MNRANVISLCCGAGIGEDGIDPYFRTVLAVDSDWRSCCSHLANHRGARVVHGDANSHHVIEYAKRCVDRMEGIISTPPCPPFSVAANADPTDPRAAAFLSVLDWVEAFHPEFVIVENVLGVQRSPHLAILGHRLRFLGFELRVWRLDAADFGVPQHRERVFVVAVREGFPVPVMPAPTHGPDPCLHPYRNLRDSIGDLTEEQAMSLGCASLSKNRARIMEAVPSGGNWQDLSGWRRRAVLAACGGQKPHPRVCKRLAWDSTPGAILSGAQVKTVTMPLHPTRNRPLSVVEHLRLMGIRREFTLFGSIKDRYRMVGNGVPPALMSAVCRAVAEAVVSPKRAFREVENF